MAKGLSNVELLYITTHQTPRFETISLNVYKKSPYLVALENAKPHPHFSKITARKQKEKAAIAVHFCTLITTFAYEIFMKYNFIKGLLLFEAHSILRMLPLRQTRRFSTKSFSIELLSDQPFRTPNQFFD